MDKAALDLMKAINDTPERPTMISLSGLDVNVRYPMLKAEVVPKAQYGRTVAVYVIHQGAERYVYLPKRYSDQERRPL